MIHTNETKAEIGRLAEMGLSASQIAAEMGFKSRRVVIGIAHRNPDLIQLHGRSNTSPKDHKPASVMRAKPPPMLCQPVEIETEGPRDDLIELHELTESTCRFPFGDHNYKFCGRPKWENMPYCANCCRRAYQQR